MADRFQEAYTEKWRRIKDQELFSLKLTQDNVNDVVKKIETEELLVWHTFLPRIHHQI